MSGYLEIGAYRVKENPKYTEFYGLRDSEVEAGTMVTVSYGTEYPLDADGDVFLSDDYVSAKFLERVAVEESTEAVMVRVLEDITSLLGVEAPEFERVDHRSWDEHFSVDGSSWYTAAEDVDRDVKNFLTEALNSLVSARGLQKDGGFVGE